MSKYRADSLFESEEAEDLIGGHIIRVAFESGLDREFDYLVPDRLLPIEAGRRVEVPFGRADKLQIGFCVATDISRRETRGKKKKIFKLKRVHKVVDKEPLLGAELMGLARWLSSYYVCPLGQALAAMVPAAVKKGAGVKMERQIYLAIGAEDCKKVIEQLRGKKQKEIVKLLQKRSAFASDRALHLQGFLETIGCGKEPVKRLAEKQIIKIAERTVLKSLPAIPKGMAGKYEEVVLNEDQKKALAHINDRLDSGRFGVTLLHGVTDSGKTELYIRAIARCLRMDKGAIVLLPEIALTTQTVQRFANRFKKLAVMHSGLTAAQRNSQWQKIKAGQADVVIGARSAVFAPLRRLGLVIVDEEHEPSYKQDTVPRYHGRDVAIKRAQLANAHCILGSATPSLETLTNCRNKKYFTRVTLPKRVMDLPGPQMQLVDMRTQPTRTGSVNLISEPLAEHLSRTLEKKEQAILL